MKKICLVVFGLLLYFMVQGQTYFNKNYDYNGITNNSGGHLILSDTTIFLPTTYYSQTGTGTLRFMYIDKQGDTINSTAISFPNTFLNISSSSPIYDPADSAIIFSCARIDSVNNMNSFICKVSLSGDTIWTSTINYPGYDLTHAILIDTNSYIFIGLTNSFGAGSYDVLFYKVSKNGGLIQSTAIGTTAPEGAISACWSGDGNILISGPENSDDLLMKVDRNGNLIWRQVYPFGMGQCFVSIDSISDIYIASSKVGPANTDNLVLRKTDSTGIIIWERTYINTSAYVASINPIYIAPNGFLYLSSATTSFSISKGFLWCFAPNGDSLWSVTYESTPGLDAYLTDLSPFPGGGFLMSGFANSPTQLNNAWLVRVDSNGCFIPGCLTSVEVLEQAGSGGLQLMPNPASEQLTIYLPQSENNSYVEIISATGEKVAVYTTSALAQLTVNTNEFPQGLYMVVYYTASGKRNSERLIIAR
jgi:hypothetical protein